MKTDQHTYKQLWLSGNEAIALGAYEADVKVATGYPGTPSTEILSNLSQYEGVYTEWSTNEKVAVEIAIGASFAGVRALSTMKHVGLNVAADPLFTASYTGCRGGLVIVSADDPNMYSSQNEQDNRNYALAAKIPMLEPADPVEAKEFIKIAFDLSEKLDTPVLFRITTRLAHAKGTVKSGPKSYSSALKGLLKRPEKFVMVPAIARKRRKKMSDRHAHLIEFAESFAGNRLEINDTKQGFITSGVAYLYVKEAFPEASILKLGLTYPLPEQMILDFAAQVKELFIVEELDPFLELQIKSLGITCKGKEIIPQSGELTPNIIKQSITGSVQQDIFDQIDMPARPPNMCPGCPHRGLFYNLSQLDVFVSGDIGCYTLAYMPPLSAIDSVVCMGASISISHGIEKALGAESHANVVAVIGDSTFIHSGITALIDIIYNKGFSTVIILDNRVTAMTGLQPNPASGKTMHGEESISLDFVSLCKGIGVEHIYTINPHDIKSTFDILVNEINRTAPSVIISQAPCALLPDERGRKKNPVIINIESCIGCKKCLMLNCPALVWQDDYAVVDEKLCNCCGQCVQLCDVNAIVEIQPK